MNVNGVAPKQDGVKVVMGPGTGLGAAFLCKSKFSDRHDVYPAEIGFNDWLPKSPLEIKIAEFVKNKDQTDRIGINRMCRGSTLPMLYEFMTQDNPKHQRVFKGLEREINSKDVIEKSKSDKLCAEAVNQFMKIFANKVSEICCQKLPYGGVYLVGGVTEGLKDKIQQEKLFMKTFEQAGMAKSILSQIPVFLIKERL